GKWEPRKIPNPDYFEETHPYKLTPIGSLALELWSMVDGVVFDNFLLTSDQSIAKQYADQLWYPKSILEGKAISSASDSVIDAIVRATKERPWLWAVYLVAILLPIILLFVFCWSKKSTKKLTDGSKKKKDEVEQDSNEQQQLLTSADNDEETEEIEIDEQQVKSNVTNVSGKDALENDDEGQDAEEEQEEEEDEEEEEVNAAETNEDESNKSSSPSASNKARRRLLRKE
ncbi:unnamed protein product, partial [Rotaria sordida]